MKKSSRPASGRGRKKPMKRERGRPRVADDEVGVKVAVRLAPHLLEQIDEEAVPEVNGMRRSDIIRNAIERHVDDAAARAEARLRDIERMLDQLFVGSVRDAAIERLVDGGLITAAEARKLARK
jgi:hypothetical protein